MNRLRRVLTGAAAGGGVALLVILAFGIVLPERLWAWEDFFFLALGVVAGGLAGNALPSDVVVQRSLAKVEKAEQELQASPKDEGLAWNVARAQIELYVSRNQVQQRSMFALTLAVICVGFGFIATGVGFAVAGKLEPGVLSATSGVILNFIAGTFLLVYRSIMNQSNDYIDVLERINAVGMSMQVLDKIEGQADLKDRTRAQVSLALLRMYGNLPAAQKKSS